MDYRPQMKKILKRFPGLRRTRTRAADELNGQEKIYSADTSEKGHIF